MFRLRGRSEEPELSSHRAPVILTSTASDEPQSAVSHTQTLPAPAYSGGGGRAQSAGPSSNRRKRPPDYGDVLRQQQQQQQQQQQPPERAVLRLNVNPYQELPTLRRQQGGSGNANLPALPPSQVLSSRPDPTRDGDVFSYYFWSASLFVAAATVVNIAINLWLIYAYDMTATFGVGGFEFFPESGVLAYVGDGDEALDVGDLTLEDGLVLGYEDRPLNIEADEEIILRAMEPGDDPEKAPEMRLSDEGLSIKNVENIQFVDPETGEVYFDFNEDQVLKLSGKFDSMSVDTVEADTIMAPLGEDLFIKSDAGLNIEAAEGIEIKGKEINFEAPQGKIFLGSEDGELVFDGDLFVDPGALPRGGHGYPGEEAQFRLCACLPSGSVFRVRETGGPPPGPPGTNGPRRRRPTCREPDPDDWEVHPCTGEVVRR